MSDKAASALDLAQLVDSQAEYLFNYALRHFPDEDVAQELVQETLLAAVESAERFRGESSPRTWLTAILRFKIIDRIRKKTREDSFDFADESADIAGFFDEAEHWRIADGPLPWTSNPEQAASERQFAGALEKCLKKLPERHRQVFLLREIDDLDQEDICNKLTVTPTNFRVILSRCRVLLRDCLHRNWFKAVVRT